MNIQQLRGFVSEEVARYHMEKLEYNVVPIGREKIEPELSNLLLFIRGNMKHLNQQSANSFNIFENTISKLPDYAIWKTSPENKENKMTFRFLEVKYRSSLPNLKKHASEDKYSLNINAQNDHNELLVHKYINNLQNLSGVVSSNQNNKIDALEFYIYIITTIDGKHTPLIGKVYSSSYSDFYTYLYTPKQLAKEKGIKKLWGMDYDIISDFFMQNDKLEYLLSDTFLIPLINSKNEEISRKVYETIETN